MDPRIVENVILFPYILDTVSVDVYNTFEVILEIAAVDPAAVIKFKY